VTAPLFYAPDGSLAGLGPGSTVLLDGPEGHHAATVRRLAAGEPVLLADGSGLLASGRVSAVGAGTVTVRLDSCEQVVADGPRFVLVQALAKNDRDEQAVEAATELGVDEIVPWQAARSVVVWKGERGARSRAKWISLVRAASKQSRRPTVPVVAEPATTAAIAGRTSAGALTLVLHEDAELPLAGVDLPEAGDVLLAVGPEGGIAPEEVDALTRAGAVPVRLGPTILRSSSAGPAALAVLNARRRWR
jgi:16S rRNA (uracil1498-N3)-methyltransferase